MTLIVGLGNPGSSYAHNRHNIGFMVIDKLVSDHKTTTISKPQFRGELFKLQNILLLKPNTYMNLSGESVRAVYDYFKPDDVIVLHDDLDLSFGALRFKRGGGSGGHNGLKSIDVHLYNEYIRIRLGIGRPEQKSDVSNYVLSDFNKAENACKHDVIEKVAAAALLCAQESMKDAANKYSQKECKEEE